LAIVPLPDAVGPSTAMIIWANPLLLVFSLKP